MKNLKLGLIVLAALMLLIGCGGKGPMPQDMPSQRDAAKPSTPIDVPEWFANAPEEDDTYIYATGIGESRQMKIAIDKAGQAAMLELSQRVSANVQSMVKNFTQEAGMDENTQIVEFYQSASQTITNNQLNGITPLKKYPYMKPGGSYIAYALYGLRKDAVNNEVVDLIKNEEALYAEFKASQAFKEMEGKMETTP